MAKKEDKRMIGLRERVKQRMLDLDINQPQLAKLCGLPSNKYISDLVNGVTKSPPHFLWELSVALNKSVRWLMTGEEENFQHLVDFYARYKPLADAYDSASKKDREIVDTVLGLKDGNGGQKKPKAA